MSFQYLFHSFSVQLVSVLRISWHSDTGSKPSQAAGTARLEEGLHAQGVFCHPHSSCLHNVTQPSGFGLLTPSMSSGHCLQPRGQLCSTSFGLYGHST